MSIISCCFEMLMPFGRMCGWRELAHHARYPLKVWTLGLLQRPLVMRRRGHGGEANLRVAPIPLPRPRNLQYLTDLCTKRPGSLAAKGDSIVRRICASVISDDHMALKRNLALETSQADHMILPALPPQKPSPASRINPFT